jgi:hypothetical protein
MSLLLSGLNRDLNALSGKVLCAIVINTHPMYFYALMKIYRKIIFIPYIILILTLYSFQQAKILYTVQSGKISFISTAPLEVIKAEANQLTGVIDAEDHSFAFSVRNKSFKGFNSPLQQEHFNENYMESDKFPKSTFSGKIIENVNLLNDGIYDIRAKGILDIHGVKQERIIHCFVNIKNNVMTVNCNFSIHLQDHNITVPRIVNQKINQEIKVNVQLTMVKS